jgi:hypothetical protein
MVVRRGRVERLSPDLPIKRRRRRRRRRSRRGMIIMIIIIIMLESLYLQQVSYCNLIILGHLAILAFSCKHVYNIL